MPAQAPFTAYIQLYPSKTGTRWEKVRELEKLGYYIDQALASDTALNLARPGGGASLSDGRFGWEYGGVSVKPAFGQTPAQATVVGFYDPDTVETDGPEADLHEQTYSDTQVFHAGAALTGPMGAVPWLKNPTAKVDAEVKALKANLEQFLRLYLPAGVGWKIIKVDLRGVVYGYGGYHFPL